VTELRIHRRIAAPIERVWRSWTDQDELAMWFWPARFGTTCSVDLRVGGAFRIDGVQGGVAVSGTYLRIVDPTTLCFTWRWDGDGEETLVTVTFTPAEGGTDLDLLHERFATHESAAEHQQGWDDCLDRLPGAVPTA